MWYKTVNFSSFGREYFCEDNHSGQKGLFQFDKNSLAGNGGYFPFSSPISPMKQKERRLSHFWQMFGLWEVTHTNFIIIPSQAHIAETSMCHLLSFSLLLILSDQVGSQA